MINKIINSENPKFQSETISELVFDTTPTVNSFNAITSDGVARAVAGASGEVPQVTDQDNGKVLTAIYDEGGAAVEWADAPSELPDTTGASQGDVLTVGSSGPEWVTPSGGGCEAIADNLSLTWSSNRAKLAIPAADQSKYTPGLYLVHVYITYNTTSTIPNEFSDVTWPGVFHVGFWENSSGEETDITILPYSNAYDDIRIFKGVGVVSLTDPSFVPTEYQIRITTRTQALVITGPYSAKLTVVKLT